MNAIKNLKVGERCDEANGDIALPQTVEMKTINSDPNDSKIIVGHQNLSPA